MSAKLLAVKTYRCDRCGCRESVALKIVGLELKGFDNMPKDWQRMHLRAVGLPDHFCPDCAVKIRGAARV